MKKSEIQNQAALALENLFNNGEFGNANELFPKQVDIANAKFKTAYVKGNTVIIPTKFANSMIPVYVKLTVDVLF